MYMWCIAQTLFTGPINVDQKFSFSNFVFSIPVLNPNLETWVLKPQKYGLEHEFWKTGFAQSLVIFDVAISRMAFLYRVLQTIQMKLILSWVWAEWAVLGRAKTALKFKYEI